MTLVNDPIPRKLPLPIDDQAIPGNTTRRVELSCKSQADRPKEPRMMTAEATANPTRNVAREEARVARKIEHVVVLGANGTMGYGSAALFTSAVPKVTMLARTREKADQGLSAAIKAVRSPTVGDRVSTGSYDDLERALANADLIFEAVTEQLDLKREFFARIDRA